MATVAALERAEEIHMPIIVLGELRAGFAASQQRTRNEAVLRAFLLKPGVRVLLANEETTLQYAAVYRQLRAQGTRSPPTTCGSRRWSCSTDSC